MHAHTFVSSDSVCAVPHVAIASSPTVIMWYAPIVQQRHRAYIHPPCSNSICAHSSCSNGVRAPMHSPTATASARAYTCRLVCCSTSHARPSAQQGKMHTPVGLPVRKGPSVRLLPAPLLSQPPRLARLLPVLRHHLDQSGQAHDSQRCWPRWKLQRPGPFQQSSLNGKQRLPLPYDWMHAGDASPQAIAQRPANLPRQWQDASRPRAKD